MVKTEQKPSKKQPKYSWFLKRQISIEYLEGKKTLMELGTHYCIPHQTISLWARNYANDRKSKKGHIFSIMTNEDEKSYALLKLENERLKSELAAIQTDKNLKDENESLKKDLEFAQMKAKAMEIIVDLAKEEYGIDLTKNSGAKQPVKSKKTTLGQK